MNYHPYVVKRRHELKETDLARRINFSNWLIQKFMEDGFLGKIVIGDEAAFALNGHVASRNVRMYAEKGNPPEFNFYVPCSPEKTIVWAAVCGQILGPFFIEENLNADAYLQLLDNDVVPEMRIMFDYDLFGDVCFPNCWWFQDGAPAHRNARVTERLRNLFGNQTVALNHRREWPPRSPDLTPCDFFLWGYVKCKVYKTPPPNIYALRERITAAFVELQNEGIIERAVRAMEKKSPHLYRKKWCTC